VTDEEQAAKLSRRARRRAEQGEPSDELAAAESNAPTSGEAATTPEAEDSEEGAAEAGAAATGVADTVREENRKARRAAAARRRAKRDKQQRQSIDVGLDAGEMVDDALARSTDRLFRFARRHFNLIQWVVVLAIAGGIGWQIYRFRTETTAAKVSDALMSGVAAEQGRLGSPSDRNSRDDRGNLDARLVFATEDAKLEAAAQAYEETRQVEPKSHGATLATLGLAGVRYDQGKYDDAIRLYEEVARSDLAKTSPDTKGRALEGIALALEAKKQPDQALKKYQELENAEIDGFGDQARYHQARILHAKGDDEKAKTLLTKIVEKESKKRVPTEPPAYLERGARELLETIDPKAVPKDGPDEALKKALEQFQKNLPEGVKVPVIPTQLPSTPAP
jgi:tetratricopeptide (TPR) repeat protein